MIGRKKSVYLSVERAECRSFKGTLGTGLFIVLMVALLVPSVAQDLPLSATELQAYPHFSSQAASVKIVSQNDVIRDTTVQLAGYSLPPGSRYAVVESGEVITSIPEDTHTPGLNLVEGQKFLLPFKLITRTKNQATVILDIILINRTPMILDVADRRFHGNILVRLLNRNDPTNASIELDEPVSFEIVSSRLENINPAKINVSQVNTDSHEIQCISKSRLTDSVDVKIVPAFKPEGYTFYLDVEPYLEIISNKETIPGLGIHKIPVTIMINGSTLEDSIPVSLEVSKGSVEPHQINVSTVAPSVFTVRSESLGKAEITGHSPNVMIIPDTITYVFPWLFIIFALGGGLLGALAKIYIGPGSNTVTLKHILLGGVYGFIGAVVWFALGINLLPFELPAVGNEFAALGVSALISLGFT
jgi:hypothetical protein